MIKSNKNQNNAMPTKNQAGHLLYHGKKPKSNSSLIAF